MKRNLTHYYETKVPALDLEPGLREDADYPAVPPANAEAEAVVPISAIEDIVEAREKGQALAKQLGFTLTQRTVVATAISELASNILLYAGCGEIILAKARNHEGVGIVITARDEGPGIADLGHALASGYASSGGLGQGLPGIKHLMDEFWIDSSPGRGTTVTATMWR